MTAKRSSSHLLVPLLPTDNAHAASKKYVDDEVASVVSGSVTIDSIPGLRTELDSKADTSYVTTSLSGKSDVGHHHVIGDVDNLQTALDGKSNTGHGHVIADITNLQTTLDTKAVDTSVVHKSGTETITGSKTFSSSVNMGGQKITNMADPTGAQEAATKAYVDNRSDPNSARALRYSSGWPDRPNDTLTTIFVGGTTLTPPTDADIKPGDVWLVEGDPLVEANLGDLNDVAFSSLASGDVVRRSGANWVNQTVSGLKSDLALTKSDVGLNNVDNVSLATERGLTRTLTNARITKRVQTVGLSPTPTISGDLYDQGNIYNLNTNMTSLIISGTPTDGQMMMVRIMDDGTARSLAFGSSIISSGTSTLPTTTVPSKVHHVGLIWDAAKSKWVCIAADMVGY